MLGGDDDEEALRLEDSFIDFVEAGWPFDRSCRIPDAALSSKRWPSICRPLPTVRSSGLLINVPPRCSKTLLTSVAARHGCGRKRRTDATLRVRKVKILVVAYGHSLSILNSNLTRRLILSDWYQSLWRARFRLMDDQNTKLRFDTDAGGSRIATSVGGSLLGLGGDLIIVDDPHDTVGY